MAASGERPRRGPAPIASFDHDVSDETSPETKQTFQLPEIREDLSAAGPSREGTGAALGVRGVGEARARSHSTPGLVTPAAPRIDISRASSSSHQDSRDSSPELALFAGAEPAPDHLGFREDGALELRSSTEELAFLEPEPPPAPPPAPPPVPPPAPPLAPVGSVSRRHSRKDSQGSEVALLAAGVSGRTSRLSSVGSQCSAISALSHVSHVSHLSVVSGASRSPSPHKMLLETSFCGPKPIETDPEVCAAAVEERLLEITKQEAPAAMQATADARDRREVRTEARVEAPRPPRPAPEPPAVAITPPAPATDTDKREKETRNRKARSRERRDKEPEVYKSRNRSKDVIRIKLKPDEEDDDDDDEEESERTAMAAGAGTRKPDSLSLGGAHPAPPAARSPSPLPPAHSRKSSFCSLFKSRETIASPDSPSEAVRRKKSVSEGRSRSKSRERSAPPGVAGGKLRGSVLALFKAPRHSAAASPSPPSRAASPAPVAPLAPAAPPPPALRHLKYYEDTRDGIIHIPLRTPPDEDAAGAEARAERPAHDTPRPASAPCTRPTPAPAPPTQRTVLPDGSIIIPLHSPTEKKPPVDVRRQVAAVVETPPATAERRTSERSEKKERTPESDSRTPSVAASASSPVTVATPATPVTPMEAAITPEQTRPRRKERLVFSTNVGSMEQVFSTQFSITKTPSVTSEISESFPSLPDEPRAAPSCSLLRDTRIAAEPAAPDTRSMEIGAEREVKELEEASGRDRDSSESEGSSEAGVSGVGGAAGRGCEVEARGLVVQESFEEELPFVPTTLPLERSLALPMLPVRERGPHTSTTASVERPRSATTRAPLPPPPAPALAPTHAPAPPPHERLRIRLPRRASHTQTNTSTGATAHPRPSRSRTRSGSDARKTEWIDFSEVPERRPAARRIQTLPARDGGGGAGDEPAVSYVEPDQCRCECHRAASPAHAHTHSSPEDEGDAEQATSVAVCVSVSRPFTADLDVRDEARS